MSEGLRFDFGAQVADKNVVMLRGVDFSAWKLARRRRPVHLHLFFQTSAPVHGRQSRRRGLQRNVHFKHVKRYSLLRTTHCCELAFSLLREGMAFLLQKYLD